MALQGTATGQRQKMNRGDTLITLLKVPTNEKAMWWGREEEASRYLPHHFLVWPGFSYSCSCIFFTKYDTPKKQTNKQTNKVLQATSHVCRLRSGYEPTSFSRKKWLRSRGPQLSRQNQKPHGKNKNITAKPKTLRQKQNTSRQNQKLHGKTKYFTAKTK